MSQRMDINLNKVEFVRSAASEKQFIRSSVPSVVFAGKSNVGKSSVINRILNRKNLAHVGNTPGKTVHVNYFIVDGRLYLVDLPGYGFANVARSEKDRWSALMESFFAEPDSITLGVFIVDARHSPTKDDVRMAKWFQNAECPYVVVANKLDKLKKSEIDANLAQIREVLEMRDADVLIPFSAQTGQGREALLSEIRKIL